MPGQFSSPHGGDCMLAEEVWAGCRVLLATPGTCPKKCTQNKLTSLPMIEAVSSGHSPVEGWLDLARIVLCSVTITWLDNPLRYGDGQQLREQHQNTKDDH